MTESQPASLLHPEAVLHAQGEASARGSVPPPCEHYAGDEKKLRKALALQDELAGAFDVTADLEDGAPSGAESQTARLLAAILAEPRNVTYRVGCRVHPADHPAFEDDVTALLTANPAGLAYITIPKISGRDQLDQAVSFVNAQSAALAAKAGRTTPPLLTIQAMIEDEAGLHQVFQVAAHPQVGMVSFGQMDFTSSHRGAIPVSAMQSPGQFDHPLMRRAKLEVSAACHAFGRVPTHNPTTDYASPSQAFDDARRARNEFGFMRMWSIHPSQIPQILKAFEPTAQEISDACRILLAAQAAGWGPIADRGLLHDRASYRYYWTLLKRARQGSVEIPPTAVQAFFNR
jgi:citrate lyase subunit beta / citryl-CoA lyase